MFAGLNRKQILFIFVAVVTLAALLFAFKYKSKQNNLLYVNEAIRIGQDNLLARKIAVTGLFIYDFDLSTLKAAAQDHEVRQMGAIYALAQAAEFENNPQRKKNFTDELKDSVNKVKQMSYTFKCGERKCVILSYHDKTATGSIYLLFNAALVLAKMDSVWLDENKTWLKQLLNTVLWTQKENGDFAVLVKSENDREFINLSDSFGFAIGEAVNSLARATLLHGGGVFKDELSDIEKALNDAFEFLQKRGAQNKYHGLYLWLMDAAYLAKQNTALDKALQDKIVAFTLDYHKYNKSKIYIVGKYNSCADSEGLARLIWLKQQAGVDYNADKELFLESINSNLDMQIARRNQKLLKRKLQLEDSVFNDQLFKGAFLSTLDKSKANLRVDYLQHCLSMLYFYDKI